jgi:hypothetical protein
MTAAWILGAGFSKAISDEMPTMAELGRAICCRLIADKRLEALLNPAELVAISAGNVPLGDVEIWLTSLASPQPFLTQSENLARASLSVGLAGTIAAEVTDCQSRVGGSAMPDWLASLLTLWHYGEDAVLTLNYDTLIEAAMRELHLYGRGYLGTHTNPWHALREFPRVMPTDGARLGGSEPPLTFELLKLHGSTNWFILADGAEVCRADELLPQWSSGVPGVPHYLAAAMRGATPAVLIPTADKGSSYSRPVFANIWQAARKQLSTATELVLFGYSLPQSDSSMRALLLKSLQPDVEVTIVDPDASNVRLRLQQLGPAAKGRDLEVGCPEFDEALLQWARDRSQRVDWSALDESVLPLYVSARDSFGAEFSVVGARRRRNGGWRLTVADEPKVGVVLNSLEPVSGRPQGAEWQIVSADGRELVPLDLYPIPTAADLGTNVVVSVAGIVANPHQKEE